MTGWQQSAEFYRQVFGWTIRGRGDGATAFDDTVDEVSGAWVLDHPPATAPGLNPNTPPPATPLVSGPVIRLPGRHGKVRRDGYRGGVDTAG